MRAGECLRYLTSIWDNDFLLVKVSAKRMKNGKFRVEETSHIELNSSAEHWLKQAWAILDLPHGGMPSTFRGAILFMTETMDKLREFIKKTNPLIPTP